MPTPTPSSATSQLSINFIVSVISLILLIFTSVLSYYSYSAQARTGVREALEQLDDVEINNKYKIKPILHRFRFRPLSPESSLLLKIYKTQHNEAAASVPVSATEQVDNDFLNAIITQLTEDEDLDELLQTASIDRDGVHFELSTRNAVSVRRFANRVMTIMRDEWLDNG
ncbi:hypothetical protein [Haloarcula sediminis]|uniref:hypothetical protein n=1 Tax=Haloarcula sediminis TaxID=3111777 RepID=UPI002D778DBF|nr:hypothetical protein [Haloarcula sp. CK38]